MLETADERAPAGAAPTLVGGEAGRHEYASTPRGSALVDLLSEARAQTQVLDVETHRAPIDDVIADIYERWQREPR